jgi:putative ABC transport system ATP-binding protein
MLAVNGLSYAYPGGAALRFPDFALAAGETAVVAGPSGSGKSTLLMLIAGLLTPATGDVQVAGRQLSEHRGAAGDALRGQLMGVVLQSFRLLGHLSVVENVVTAQFFAGRRPDRAQARAVLASLDIADLAERRPDALSRGQLQRAAIARAVVNRPPLLLADEPTSSLDDDAAEAVLALLTDVSGRLNAGLLVATHDSRVKARFSRIVELRQSAEGAP